MIAVSSYENRITELYVGLIGRAPDRSGLDFWVRGYTNHLANGESGDAALAGVAQDMFHANATSAYYPSGLSDVDHVSKLEADADIDGATALLDAVNPQTNVATADAIEEFVARNYQGPLNEPRAPDTGTPVLELSPVTDYAADVAFVPGSNSLGYYELYYGDVLLTVDGANAVKAGESLPAVHLRATDSDGHQASAMVQPTYADDYPIDSVDTNAVIGVGETIDADLERSGDQVASDQVGASDRQASLVFRPDQSGTFYVVADSDNADGAGSYSLTASENHIPVANETDYVGAVVGENDVLTASHVFYSASNGGLADSITVYPGRDGAEQPYGSYTSGDLAVLGFDAPLGNRTGWFGLDSNGESGNYNLTGYPGLFQSASGPRMTNDLGVGCQYRRALQ